VYVHVSERARTSYGQNGAYIETTTTTAAATTATATATTTINISSKV